MDYLLALDQGTTSSRAIVSMRAPVFAARRSGSSSSFSAPRLGRA